MPEYRVIWEVDVEADSPEEAALEAAEIQAAQTTEKGNGGYFLVMDWRTKKTTPVDLEGWE